MEFILHTYSMTEARIIAGQLFRKISKRRPETKASIIQWMMTRNVLWNIMMDLEDITQVHDMVRQHLRYNGACCSLRDCTPYPSDRDDDNDDEGVYEICV